jgi:hypothetical protein
MREQYEMQSSDETRQIRNSKYKIPSIWHVCLENLMSNLFIVGQIA